MTNNKCTVKDSFAFAEEIVEQDSKFFMVASFTNIPLEETIDICANTISESTEWVEGLLNLKFKELVTLATKESYFVFNGQLFK